MNTAGEEVISYKLDGIVWNTVLSTANDTLIFDVRQQETQTVEYWKMELTSLELQRLPISHKSWWTSLEAVNDQLYVCEYQDKADPANKKWMAYGKEKTQVDASSVPPIGDQWQFPFHYEIETENHQLVASYLGLQLPLACEYLEIDQKIIISYYLRSDNRFDRYLLYISDGKKQWKILQDQAINGFAPGAFFVLNDRIFFVKNRDEVNSYPL